MPSRLKPSLVIIFFIGVLIDVFVFETGSDLRLFGLVFFWLILIKIYKLKSDITLKMTLVYLFILFLLFIFARSQPYTDRVATWIYMFLIIGVFQQFREIKSS